LKILIAPDSFKGSLTSPEAANAMAFGIRSVRADAELAILPLADGGEGTARVLAETTGGEMRAVEVHGPLGKPQTAKIGISGDGETAFVEMASASGLTLVPIEHRNPLYTSTYGTGELIRAALDTGCSRIIVGIGGSATNDGGCGMAQALGVRFYSNDGLIDEPVTGVHLEAIKRIEVDGLDHRIRDVKIDVACDVTNPLFGPNGAAHIYSPQKGADAEIVERLERGMIQAYNRIETVTGLQVRDIPGAGAAGGLGAGLVVFLGARLQSGIQLVMDALGFDEKAQNVDLVLSGEGQLDSQSNMGKVIGGVLEKMRPYRIPVWAFAGSVLLSETEIRETGLAGAVHISPPDMPVEEAMRQAYNLLRDAVKGWAFAQLG